MNSPASLLTDDTAIIKITTRSDIVMFGRGTEKKPIQVSFIERYPAQLV